MFCDRYLRFPRLASLTIAPRHDLKYDLDWQRWVVHQGLAGAGAPAADDHAHGARLGQAAHATAIARRPLGRLGRRLGMDEDDLPRMGAGPWRAVWPQLLPSRSGSWREQARRM